MKKWNTLSIVCSFSSNYILQTPVWIMELGHGFRGRCDDDGGERMSNTTQRLARFDQMTPMSYADLAGTHGGALPVALAVAYSGAIISGLTAGVVAGWYWCEKKLSKSKVATAQ